MVIRSRGSVSGDFVILRREDTRFYSQVRPGDQVTVKYNMMATDVSLAAPERVVVPRHRY
jgi:3-hydroxymyristoyl/3-hydroxydecanoyl-(acyl carrier protein) dehydratase